MTSDNTLIKLIESNEAISDKQKVAEIIIYLIGGHDTTGYSIASTLVLLGKHRDKLSNLRADTNGIAPGQWSKSSQYFNYVLKETFRCMPVVATGPIRRVGKDFDAGNGEVIPRGATVILPQFTVNRNTEIFSDADNFDPDRWYNATDEMKNTLMPFAAGTRNCVGQSLATAELETILPYILSQFKINLIEEGITDNFLTLKFGKSKLKLTCK